MSLYDRIPGYWAAVAAEAEARDAAFLNLPLLVAGIEVRPLTLRDYLRLSTGRSPFVCGGPVDRSDIAFLLWYQRPAGSPFDEAALAEFKLGFDGQDLHLLTAAVGEYVDRALRDRPTGSRGGSAPVVGSGAVFVHALMRAYPRLSDADVLDMALEKLWGLYRCIQLEKNPEAMFANPLSDRTKAEHGRRRDEDRARQAEEAKRPRRRRKPATNQ